MCTAVRVVGFWLNIKVPNEVLAQKAIDGRQLPWQLTIAIVNCTGDVVASDMHSSWACLGEANVLWRHQILAGWDLVTAVVK